MAVTTMDPESARTSQPHGSLVKGGGSLLSGRDLGAALTSRGKHYACGSIAAFTNIMVTFPIQKVLFRQQLHGVRAREAVKQLQRDGMRNLYRGLLPPLLQKTTTVAIMFGLYEDFSDVLLDQVSTGSGIPELVTRSFAAALAGTAEAALMPFERVQTLLQDHRHHGRFHNTAHTFRTLLSEYGVKECYRGLVPVLIRNGPSNMLFFGLRGPIKEQLLRPPAGLATWSMTLCVEGAGAALGIMFYPLNVVKSRAQSQVGGAFRPCGEVLMTVWRERGGSVAMLFRGAHLNYHRSLLSWGIINATYELLLKMF